MSRSAWARRCGPAPPCSVSALAAILLAGFFTALGFLALILPGIYLSVRLAFVGQAAAIERAGARHALRISMLLTKGRFWSLLGILALVSFGGFVVATAVQAPFQAIGGTPRWPRRRSCSRPSTRSRRSR